MKRLFLFSALLCLGYCAHIDLDAYPFSSVLNAAGDGSPLYTLYWNFDTAEQTITFAVKARTNGWVGFGISPNGGMVNSDVVIGWVNDEGQAFLDDRYAVAQSLPPIDPQQDWNLIRGENEDGFTTLEFWRKWVTCDDNDRDIEANTARVVYSWNENDPANDDAVNGPAYHTNRGSASLNLLGGLLNMPPDPPAGTTGSFNITVDNVLIPSSDTTYWCAAFELPQEVQSQEKYIIRYSPIISPNEFQYVHHLLIYLCNNLEATAVGASAPCGEAVSATVSQCLSGELIAAWAVGGNDFVYPQDVAYPIGGPSGQRYLVMQVHYDNPMMQSNIRDSSGIEFIYENAPRRYNAGILLMGHQVNRLMIVPPRATNYGVTGVCSSECTSRYLPQGGINIFANLLHTHVVGRGLTLKILHRTQECGGGLQELKPVDQNLQYDFNYQQFTYLPEEIKLLPGDILLLDCNYTTTDRSGVVLGGESTREEMCFSFPVYYPRANLSTCISNPVMESFVPFAQQYIPDEAAVQAIISALQSSTSDFENALNQYISWTPDAATALEDSIRSGPIFTGCSTDQRGGGFGQQQPIPVAQCPYTAPDVCSLTDKAFGLAASVMCSLGLMVLVTLILL